MNTLSMARKKKELTPNQQLARAILDQYQPKSVEDMQNALKDIFGPMFEAMLQGEMNSHLGYSNVQFAPSSGHWCVCQRPLGGAQRPPLLRVFDRLNDNNVVLRCPLHYSVGRYFVIHDHRFPTPRFTLRTDDGTFGCFDAFFKDFHQYFDFPFIHDCI